MFSDLASLYDRRVPRNTILSALLLIGVALLAHAGALSAGWIWDDDDYITANRVVQSVDGWLTIWTPGSTPQYYPLAFLGFWVEFGIAGLDPTLYHLDNMLLHAGSALLLWRILGALRVQHAIWIALVFAAHPMGVETVAWATERKNTQSLFLALASILCFIQAGRAGEKRVVGFHIVAFTLFVCALLSKTTAIFVAPALVLIALHERRALGVRFALTVLPYFVVGAALGLFTAFVEKTHVGARGGEFSLSILARVLLAARNIVFYIAHFILPIEQVFVYPRREISTSSVPDWIPIALMLVLLGACVRAWRRSRAPLLVLLWLCAALFPALGFFDVWPFRFSFVADHFAYAAMPAMATGLVLVVGLIATHHRRPHAQLVALAIGVAACVPLSWVAAVKYASAEALWRDTIARNPEAWLAQNNLASELLTQSNAAALAGDSERARILAAEAFERSSIACQLKPDELTHPSNQSEALRLLGRFDEALTSIDRAIELAPHLAELRWMRGRLLEELGRLDDANAAYASAADDPKDRSHVLDARRSMLALAVKRKDYDAAVGQARAVISLSPGDADAIANLGALLIAKGDAAEGRAAYLRALTGRESFSGERAFVTTTVRYLRLAIESALDPGESVAARRVAEQFAAQSNGDPSARYFMLALALRSGDAAARGDLEKLERAARAANATAFADEVAAYLRAH